MNKDLKDINNNKTTEFSLKVDRKASRKIRARHNPTGVWFGLGMMGLIGWSVVVPTLLGAFIGTWLDKHYPESRSWTLVLLIAGLCIGCLNAWYWMSQQHRDMLTDQDHNNE